MNFGSDRTFEIIKDVLTQKKEEAYEPLCKILYEDVGCLMDKFFHGVQKADKDDLIQNVVWKVIRDLPRFYESSAGYLEQQRNAYLKRVVRNECLDFFKKNRRTVLKEMADFNDAQGEAATTDFVKQIIDKESFYQALRRFFLLKTTPDKLLAFVYNRLLSGMSGSKGSPLTIIEDFDGMFLREIYERMVLDLNHVLGEKVPSNVLEPLKKRVYGRYYNERFRMTARTITDSGSNFVKKVKEQTKNEKGSN